MPMHLSRGPGRRRAAVAASLWAMGLAAACHGGAHAKSPADAVPGEVLVVLRQGDAVVPLLRRYGLSITGRFGSRPIFRLKLVSGADVGDTVAALAAEPAVVSAEPNVRHAAPEAVRNNVWAVGTPEGYATQWAGPAIGLGAVRGLASGAGVRVAVLDTGFELAHPALAGRWLPGWDFVDGDPDPTDAATAGQAGRGHGTHVAGLLAWVAPGAWLRPYRVLDNEGQGNAWVLAEAMLRAVDPDGNPNTPDGAQVINLSMAGRERTRLMATVGALTSCSVPAPTDNLVDLSDAGYNDDRVRCAAQGGAVVVAGAGNDGSASLRTYPAAESAYGLVSVAASAADGRLARFSNSGNWIALAAPGEGLTSAVSGGGYGSWSGTSMATPLVAGAAALVRERFPTLAPKDLARCLVAASSPLDGTRLRQLNAAAALTALLVSPQACR